MFWCSIFVLVICNVWLSGMTFGAPMAQMQMPQLPQFVNYIGNQPLPGGTLTSLLSANFTPGQMIASSGIPGFLGDTGTAGAFDMIGNSISQAGIGVGNSVGTLFSGLVHGISEIFSGIFGLGRVNNNVMAYNNPLRPQTPSLNSSTV